MQVCNCIYKKGGSGTGVFLITWRNTRFAKQLRTASSVIMKASNKQMKNLARRIHCKHMLLQVLGQFSPRKTAPRIIVPCMITPRYLPPGQLPPRKITPRTIAPEDNCNTSPSPSPRKFPPHYKIFSENNCCHSSKFPSKSTTSEHEENYALSTSTLIKESFYQKLFFKAAT